LRVEDSHPFAKKKANGWGTERFDTTGWPFIS
jgi:hypothetical protein